jgi:hypothetical protein
MDRRTFFKLTGAGLCLSSQRNPGTTFEVTGADTASTIGHSMATAVSASERSAK